MSKYWYFPPVTRRYTNTYKQHIILLTKNHQTHTIYENLTVTTKNSFLKEQEKTYKQRLNFITLEYWYSMRPPYGINRSVLWIDLRAKCQLVFKRYICTNYIACILCAYYLLWYNYTRTSIITGVCYDMVITSCYILIYNGTLTLYIYIVPARSALHDNVMITVWSYKAIHIVRFM